MRITVVIFVFQKIQKNIVKDILFENGINPYYTIDKTHNFGVELRFK